RSGTGTSSGARQGPSTLDRVEVAPRLACVRSSTLDVGELRLRFCGAGALTLGATSTRSPHLRCPLLGLDVGELRLRSCGAGACFEMECVVLEVYGDGL